jgi:hypothetical protein
MHLPIFYYFITNAKLNTFENYFVSFFHSIFPFLGSF